MLSHMAQKMQVELIDDIDGSSADETVRFQLDGVEYEIDLSARHAEALRESAAEWIATARRVGGRKATGRRRAGHGAAVAASDARKIREWARENGYTVSDRGRIPANVTEAYTKAH